MPRERFVRSLLVAVLFWLLPGCVPTEDATQVIVVVRTDLMVGEELDALEIRLLDADDLGNDSLPRHTYALAREPRAGQHDFPLSFTVVPKSNQSRRDFRLVATGFLDGDVVVEQQAIASFFPEKALLLEIFLSRNCRDKLCRDGAGQRTANACEYVYATCEQVTPGELTEIDPGTYDAGPLDGVDAGPRDSGMDAMSDPDAPDGDLDDGDTPDVIPGDLDASDGSMRDADATTDARADADADADAPTDADASAPDATEGGLDANETGPTPMPCSPNPCQNSGICVASGASFTCDCSMIDFEGPRCATARTPPCTLNPCLHGGACTRASPTTRNCNCANTGYTGTSCETNLNECLTSNVCSGSFGGNSFSYSCRDLTGDTPGYTCTGHFPDWASSFPSGIRFTVSTGIVTDALTNLNWQQAVPATNYNWDGAVSYCSTLSLTGTGWRLPTRAELLSIVDYTRANPAIDPSAFPGTPNADFWAASAYVGTGPSRWHVFFQDGSSSPDLSTGTTMRVRCVR